MVTVALLVRLEAKPGKESELERFLSGALPLVQEEPATVACGTPAPEKLTPKSSAACPKY